MNRQLDTSAAIFTSKKNLKKKSNHFLLYGPFNTYFGPILGVSERKRR